MRLHLRSRLASPSLHLLGVYVAGLVVGFRYFATAEAGQDAVIHSIPFQLYGILTIVMIFLVALGFLLTTAP